MKIEFSNDELQILSEAILAAIYNNCEAAKLTTSHKAVDAISAHSEILRHLNDRICRAMVE